MSINELKNLIHSLVDKSNNKSILELIYNLFSSSDQNIGEDFWDKLNDEQRSMILKSFEQSENEDKLISHDEVIRRIKNEL